MRNISFALTTRQYEDGTKDVTRRRGWGWLVEHFAKGGKGVLLGAVRKGQGIPKGGKIERLNPPAIEVVGARSESLDRMLADREYGRRECVREGFPDLTPHEFVAMYCKHNGGMSGDPVTRIEFRRPFICPTCGSRFWHTADNTVSPLVRGCSGHPPEGLCAFTFRFLDDHDVHRGWSPERKG